MSEGLIWGVSSSPSRRVQIKFLLLFLTASAGSEDLIKKNNKFPEMNIKSYMKTSSCHALHNSGPVPEGARILVLMEILLTGKKCGKISCQVIHSRIKFHLSRLRTLSTLTVRGKKKNSFNLKKNLPSKSFGVDGRMQTRGKREACQ